MDTPKLMAACVKRSNFDVVCTIVPELIFRYHTPGDVFGMFLVINNPKHLSTEFQEGIILTNELLSEETFEKDFVVPRRVDPFNGEFFRTRHKHGGGLPMRRSYLYQPRQ
jgi:hypothetical protein